MLLNSKFFRFFLVICSLLILLAIVYMTAKISFIFRPLAMIFNILILPFMLAGFFYYLLRPLVTYFEKIKINKTISIILIYCVLAAAAVVFFIIIWPLLQTQIENFIKSAPELIKGFQAQINKIQENRLVAMFVGDDSDLSTKLSEYLNTAITIASNYISNIFAIITSFVIVIATAPIILYYMLKESEHIPSSILHIIPRRFRKDGREVILEIDDALSGFIVGRVIITCLLGVLLYIGFMIIGLPYALLLAVIATVLNIIPYIGQFLGAIPCLIVAFIDAPSMIIWVVIVTVIAQQIESSFLSPHIYGKRLDIHPLTTIILLLVAGDIVGILGVILAIPAYMVVKIIIVRIYRIFLADKFEELIE
ncbi:AI-2E family transporter [Paenibacillus psychroresistens]|uniref:AI-2E family transporter n=1 Tax=Paenibacillus psychroresistens TaxID=1778678 RepID=A0A6B8RNZ0_9BACL|nr:AI-2E family transporter [Paenibacillus psychroresistens]QGQ97275.1 AI-2E family transporter [Paenibacillus psychroresistens]